MFKVGDEVILYRNTDSSFLNCRAILVEEVDPEDWDTKEPTFFVDIYTKDTVYRHFLTMISQMRKLTKLDNALK